MAVVWGEAEVVLHTDGRALPGEVRDATQVAATTGGKEFQKRFRAQMRRAAIAAVGDFAKSFSAAMGRFLRSTRTFNVISRRVRMLRTDFRILSNFVRGTFSDAMRSAQNGLTNLLQPLADFRREVGERSAAAVRELREGMQHLKITSDDLRDTFPGLARVVDSTRERFHAFRDTVDRTRVSLGNFRDRVLARLRPVADEVGDAWQRMTERFGKLRVLADDNRTALRSLRTAWSELRKETIDSTRVTDENERSHGRLRRTVTAGVGPIRRLLSTWKRLPHGFRQAVFWTTLVITALGSLSVLSSALSGTIVTLITMVGALAAAVGFAAAGFAGLYAEGANLTAGAQASKDALDRLGESFKQIRENIANNMFENMASSIEQVTNNLLPALEGNINAFASRVGDNIGRIFEALSSPSGIENFQALLDGFGPILDHLTTAAIGFGDAFADILILSLPTAEAFAGAIADVAEQFSEWTSSEEGRERIKEFFATAERIMPKVVDLVVEFSKALSGLVTPTTIAGFEQFLDSMIQFMPILGQIVEVIANLNVFGIIAAALQAVGAVLEPLLPVLAEFATLIGQALVEGLQTLMPYLGELGAALVPVIQFVGELVVAALPPLIDIIVAVIENLAAWIDMIVAVVDALIGGEEGAKEFGKIVSDVFNTIAGVITFTTTIITGILKAVAALLKGDTAGAMKFLEDAVRKAFAAIGIDFDDLIKWVAQLWTDVDRFFGQIVREIQNFGRDVANVFGGVINWIRDAVNWFGNLFGAANSASGAASRARTSAGGARAFASGGLLNGPTRILAGEAGPEAIVPLRRPLSMVDPSVRWLSALAQGKTPSFANGGVVGGGKTINIEPGAITVVAPEPRRAAVEVVNRIVERVA